MKAKYRVILTDDHTIIRDGIKALLQDEDDIQVIGEAASGEELLFLLPSTPADVVVLDIKMPGMDGFETASQIKNIMPQTQVLALTMMDHEHYILQMMKAGANGYLLKSVGKMELAHAIKMVANGGSYISTEIALNLLHKYCSPTGPGHQGQGKQHTGTELSKRELEVLQLIADGLTNQEIAEKLFTSKRTIETHRQNLLEKTQTKNTASLITYAFSRGILNPQV
ncbi:response regulator [Nibribacter ruber]|uniref:Response regulator n=1 Tax=Nibribacter ruber TaxID=2698458 RepID=A0A6P1NWG6_9BACT|nr:response regulator transcription factor [Nibribacter ruber]QHL86135.1 response regulator [Nibribacter ruber]